MRFSKKNIAFDFMKAGSRPKGPPTAVATVTKALKSAGGAWAARPVWNGAYWSARADFSQVTASKYRALLQGLDAKGFGVRAGPRAYLPR